MRVAFCFLMSVALLLTVGSSHVLAQHQGSPCSLDRLAGDYGFLTSYNMAGTEVNATGTVRINRDGTTAARLLANMGGNYVEFNRYGTATAYDDCTTKQSWDDGGDPAHCVVVDDGNEIWCIYEGPVLSTVTLKRIHTRD